MSRQQVALGDIFQKAGTTRIVWRVECFNLNLPITHVVLTRVDDPTTKITISADTLANPLYFRRPVPEP